MRQHLRHIHFAPLPFAVRPEVRHSVRYLVYCRWFKKVLHTHTPLSRLRKNADLLYRLLRTMRLPSLSRNSAIVRYGRQGAAFAPSTKPSSTTIAVILDRPVLSGQEGALLLRT